ncbi:MAG: class I SAM-dependent methyltransferase [Candidatus Magasanikbacteria bacterium]|nr:class I SAM-dependent methyltransferase [Candidatus Magasanikbacteria bacterium]
MENKKNTELKSEYSQYFEVRLPPDPRRVVVWQEIVRYLQRFLHNKTAVLEVGAGYCTFINAVKADKRVAQDQSEVVAEYAEPGVVAHKGLVTNLSFAGVGEFDAVLSSNLFEHLTREEFLTSLQEIKRVLKNGGQLIIVQPNFRFAYKRYFDDYTHVQIFTDTSLAQLLRANGFEITHCEPRFTPYSMSATSLPVPAWVIRLYLRLPWRPLAGQMLVVATKK